MKNVKYALKKGAGKKVAAAEEDDDMTGVDKKKKEPKWDFAKLAVGNWFSGTRYFRAVD